MTKHVAGEPALHASWFMSSPGRKAVAAGRHKRKTASTEPDASDEVPDEEDDAEDEGEDGEPQSAGVHESPRIKKMKKAAAELAKKAKEAKKAAVEAETMRDGRRARAAARDIEREGKKTA